VIRVREPIDDSTMSSNPTSNQSSIGTSAILWSAIIRDDVILAEAGSDPYGGVVTQTARELLCRTPTPGYEYHSIRQPIRLRDCH
jgi:hypothetical protein